MMNNKYYNFILIIWKTGVKLVVFKRANKAIVSLINGDVKELFTL